MDLPIEDLRQYIANSIKNMLFFDANKQYKEFVSAREYYWDLMATLVSRLRYEPLEIVLECTYVPERFSDHEIYAGVDTETEELSNAAKSEIHRRAFKGFINVPFRKKKFDAGELGYLRKPKD